MHLTPDEALSRLKESKNLFLELFQYESLSLEIYQPKKVDLQKPHDRDEAYIIIAGTGDFYFEGETTPFNAGDFLFVPAGAEHRFINFSDDFSTWVLFFGPQKTLGKP